MWVILSIPRLIYFFRNELNNDRGRLRYLRLVTKAQADKLPAARAAMADDHSGRYNTPDSTMVLFVYKVR